MVRFLLLILLFGSSSLFVSCEMEAGRRNPEVRSDFDFLIGKWRIDSVKFVDEDFRAADGYFRFSKTLGNRAIEGYWVFRPGERLPLIESNVYWGYDSIQATWNYFYRNENLTKYFQGKFLDGEWWFHTDYNLTTVQFDHRQVWRYYPPDRLERIMENSYTRNGRSGWDVVHRTLFTRISD